MVNAEKITVYKWITLIQNKLKKVYLGLAAEDWKTNPYYNYQLSFRHHNYSKSNTLPAHLQNIKKITNEHIS